MFLSLFLSVYIPCTQHWTAAQIAASFQFQFPVPRQGNAAVGTGAEESVWLIPCASVDTVGATPTFNYVLKHYRQHLTILYAFTACYGDSFTLLKRYSMMTYGGLQTFLDLGTRWV
jgi:hypothetical protein